MSVINVDGKEPISVRTFFFQRPLAVPLHSSLRYILRWPFFGWVGGVVLKIGLCGMRKKRERNKGRPETTIKAREKKILLGRQKCGLILFTFFQFLSDAETTKPFDP